MQYLHTYIWLNATYPHAKRCGVYFSVRITSKSMIFCTQPSSVLFLPPAPARRFICRFRRLLLPNVFFCHWLWEWVVMAVNHWAVEHRLSVTICDHRFSRTWARMETGTSPEGTLVLIHDPNKPGASRVNVCQSAITWSSRGSNRWRVD